MQDDHFHCYDHGGAAGSAKERVDTFKRGDPKTKKKPGIKFYSLKKELTALSAAAGARATLSVLGKTAGSAPLGGRDVMLLKISTEWAKDKPRILLTGGMHAREWISPTYVFLVAQWLLDNYGKVPEATDIVDNFHLHIIPMCNPDGHEYSVTTNRMWRKNSAGGDPDFQTDPANKAVGIQKGSAESVDLNRNFNSKHRAAIFKSGKGKWSDDPNDDSYVGKGSAAETKLLEALITKEKFDVAVDYNAYDCWVLHSPCDDGRDLKTIDPAAGTRHKVFTGHMKKLLDAGSKKNPTTRGAPDTWQIAQVSKFYKDLYATQGLSLTDEESVIPGSVSDFAFYTKRPKATHRTLCYAYELPPMHYKGSPGFKLPERKIAAVFKTALPNTLALIKHARTASPTAKEFNAYSHLP